MKRIMVALALGALLAGCAPEKRPSTAFPQPLPTASPDPLTATFLLPATPPPNLNPSLLPSPAYPRPTPGVTPMLTPAPTTTPSATTTPYPTPYWLTPVTGSPKYVSREVVSVAVGPGPGDIGIKTYDLRTERDPEGPQAFAIYSAGNIYVLDNANQRVNKYTPQGRFASSVLLPKEVAPLDLAVDANGDIYVLDFGLIEGSRVLKLDQAGVLQRIYAAPEGTKGNAIRLLPDGTLAMGSAAFFVTRLGTPDREFAPEEKRRQDGLLYRDGAFIPGVIIPRPPHDRPDGTWFLSGLSLSGGKPITLSVPLLGNLFGMGVSFQDVDSEGNLFLTVTAASANRPFRPEAWVLRYDSGGRFLTLFPSHPPLYVNPNLHATHRVMHNGDVYVLQPFKDRVKVVKWEYRSGG